MESLLPFPAWGKGSISLSLPLFPYFSILYSVILKYIFAKT
jgi:hypothetical protein